MLLLDGLDEFRGDIRKTNKKDAIVSVLRGERLLGIPVIITTRPWRADEITNIATLNKQYTRIYIDGFAKENVQTYIRKFFDSDSMSAKSLIGLLTKNIKFAGKMAPFPFFCSILCFLWKDKKNRAAVAKSRTFSEIIHNMVSSLEEHYVEKVMLEGDEESFVMHSGTCEVSLSHIGEIAFNGLVEKHLIFDQDAFRHCPGSLKAVCDVGVLSKSTMVAPKEIRRKQKKLYVVKLSFPHRLLQECVASLYLASLHRVDPSTFSKVLTAKVLGHFKEFEYLLCFTAAHGGEMGKALMESLCNCVSDEEFILNVAYECHDEEANKPVLQLLRRRTTLTVEWSMTPGYLYTWELLGKQIVSLNTST